MAEKYGLFLLPECMLVSVNRKSDILSKICQSEESFAKSVDTHILGSMARTMRFDYTGTIDRNMAVLVTKNRDIS